MELDNLFPDEDAARQWFESIYWPGKDRHCPRCGSTNTHEANHKSMPYRCRDCKRYFSLKTGTVMKGSPIPLRKWVYAIYLDVTNLNGVSSARLHRDLGITQKTAWHMQQRIREAFAKGPPVPFAGPADANETHMDGNPCNMRKAKRERLTCRYPVGKTAIAEAMDCAYGQISAAVVHATQRGNGFFRG